MGKNGKSVIRSQEDEYVTIKIRSHVKEALLKMQALLQFKEGKRFSLSDLIEFLIANAPEIHIPMDEFRIVDLQETQETRRRT
jgi:hypothetical protein